MLDSNFWRRYLEVYDFLNLIEPYRELLGVICDELEIRKGERILEAGCGTGNLVFKIKEEGALVVGLDNCREALEICRRKVPGIETVFADLSEKLPFPDNYFDKIASNNTLYAIPKEKQIDTLKELRRILKPGGKIVLANLRKGWNPLKVYFEGIRKNYSKEGLWLTFSKIVKASFPSVKIFYYNYLIQKENKYHFFDLHEQEELLRQAGFSKISPEKIVYARQSILNSGYNLLF